MDFEQLKADIRALKEAVDHLPLVYDADGDVWLQRDARVMPEEIWNRWVTAMPGQMIRRMRESSAELVLMVRDVFGATSEESNECVDKLLAKFLGLSSAHSLYSDLDSDDENQVMARRRVLVAICADIQSRHCDGAIFSAMMTASFMKTRLKSAQVSAQASSEVLNRYNVKRIMTETEERLASALSLIFINAV